MHADEIAIDADAVRAVLADQVPSWAGLSVTPLAASGTDNWLFRLGDAMLVRLPRHPRAAPKIEREAAFLAQAGPWPLLTPRPLFVGAPTPEVAYPWSVYAWIDGNTPAPDALASSGAAAESLAAFITALAASPGDGLAPFGADNHHRGGPLHHRDAATRAAIETLASEIDAGAARALWTASLATPAHDGPLRALHGDIHAGNLLIRKGRLVAVIDFGLAGRGDPATDFMPAWSLFDTSARATFRKALAPDNAAWARGRGWALSVALVALAYYRGTNPFLCAVSRRTIEAAIGDLNPLS